MIPHDADWREGLSGGLAMFVDHIEATAPAPQPWIALGAALATFGVLAGRRYAGPTDCRTNLYCIGLGDSGCGKDAPLRLATDLLVAAGAERGVVGGRVPSGSAILAALRRSPSAFLAMDEVGLLASLSERREVTMQLRGLFSSASDRTVEYPSSDRRLKASRYTHQPNLGLFGVATPHALWPTLTQAHVENGTINRLLVFEEDGEPGRAADRYASPSPELVDLARAVLAGAEGHDTFPCGDTAELAPVPYRVPYADDAAHGAATTIAEAGNVLRQRLRHRPDSKLRLIVLGRQTEHAFKLALVRAVVNDPARPAITSADLVWGAQVAVRCTEPALAWLKRLRPRPFVSWFRP